jgi:3D (Asp-Asp-Asp) domain-containing protein
MLLDNSAKTQLPSLKSIIKSSIEEEEEWSKNTANYIKSCSTAAAAFIKDERPKESEGVKQERALVAVTEQTTQVVALSTFLDVDTASAINVITNGGSLELENKVDIFFLSPLKLVLMRCVFFRLNLRL